MPHSGGGGSHGGGHHGGSHHSSSRGSSAPRISSTYFPGARRYVYYRNRQAYTYYAKTPFNTKEARAVGISLLIMGLFWTGMVVLMLFGFFKVSKGSLPLDYDHEIVIDDEIGMIYDRNRLETELKSFQEKTGVTVAIVTRRPENAEFGYNVETQAYNCYVSRWRDESHWLIYYVGTTPTRNDDWEWNLMCGDDCTRVLSAAQEEVFTKNFHRSLVASNHFLFEQCVIGAMNSLKPQTGKRLILSDGVNVNGRPAGGEPAGIGMILFFALFLFIGIGLTIGGICIMCKKPTEEEIAKSNAIEIPTDTQPQQAICSYCGGAYYMGTVLSCPHCAAPVEIGNSHSTYDPNEYKL